MLAVLSQKCYTRGVLQSHFKRQTPALECKRLANQLESQEDTNG